MQAILCDAFEVYEKTCLCGSKCRTGKLSGKAFLRLLSTLLRTSSVLVSDSEASSGNMSVTLSDNTWKYTTLLMVGNSHRLPAFPACSQPNDTGILSESWSERGL